MKMLSDWWEALDRLFFPPDPSCSLCRERPQLATGTCEICLDSLSIKWEEREIHGYPYFSLLPYQGFARDTIHEMKFLGGYQIALTFGFMLGLALREEPVLAGTELLLPVPLHGTRLKQRGFNHAAVLAEGITRAWRRPLCTQLIRRRETAPQSGLSAAERKRNLAGAFAVLPGKSLQNKECLIIDDVITSGFTFSTIARLVESYGGRPAGAFVARTEKYGGGS